ncbi:hypothetical protein [Microvirga sp. 2TAF3]|uniref:hypothetical protein n=1 Tax=Microvirga sp. 2TAF3 TaxID=3233014 RepID=UPI003F9C6E59
MSQGICKLTGKNGKLIASHLIPKALTRPAVAGAPLIQYGSGKLPERRWDSWYDKHLVTQAGEDILTALDTWAITEMRKHRLVWSGWGPMTVLTEGHQPFEGTSWGIRIIKGIDTKRLRLFFLSLLWRAAVTQRFEFSEIALSRQDLEQLRVMILAGDSDPISFYPASLIQLSTIGMIHNYAPVANVKTIPAVENNSERKIPIFRFYFDGLIVHMHQHASDDDYTNALGSVVVGKNDEILVTTVTYEDSFQRNNLESVISEYNKKFR